MIYIMTTLADKHNKYHITQGQLVLNDLCVSMAELLSHYIISEDISIPSKLNNTKRNAFD